VLKYLDFKRNTTDVLEYNYLYGGRVLLEKLIFHLVKKFAAFYGTRKFITAYTRARHWFLS
jgi:hypothetical protein